MSEKMNHFICPSCGHDFYDKCAYATCDACQKFFYCSQSRTCGPHYAPVMPSNLRSEKKP
jgi:hypothetical protein